MGPTQMRGGALNCMLAAAAGRKSPRGPTLEGGPSGAAEGLQAPQLRGGYAVFPLSRVGGQGTYHPTQHACYVLGACVPGCCGRSRLGPVLWEPLPHRRPRLRDGLHHGEPHEDGADRVVLPVVGQATDAVVAVTQDLNPQLVVFLKRQGRAMVPRPPRQVVAKKAEEAQVRGNRKAERGSGHSRPPACRSGRRAR